MASSKIHCRLLNIEGPPWAEIDADITACLLQEISNMELLGDEPDLHGFVGTQQIGNAVGGFFTVQYEKALIYYDKTKNYEIKHDEPFDRVFFSFFPEVRKVLLQYRQFVDNPLNMPTILRLFILALSAVFNRCKVGPVLSLTEQENLISREQFIDEFQKSRRVTKLVAVDPDPNKIPNNFEYYNPQRERNSIIRGSHIKDYSELEKLELDARENGNIKDTHLGKDLIPISEVSRMEYYLPQEEEKRILEKEMPTRFEFTIDMDAPELFRDDLQRVIDHLARVGALESRFPPKSQDAGQLSLF